MMATFSVRRRLGDEAVPAHFVAGPYRNEIGFQHAQPGLPQFEAGAGGIHANTIRNLSGPSIKVAESYAKRLY